MPGKGDPFAVAYVNFGLPLSCVCIQRSKHARFFRRADALVHAVKQVRIFDVYGVQYSVVSSESEQFVFS